MSNRVLAPLLCLLLAPACKQQKVQSKAPAPEVPVTVATATRETVPLEVYVVGAAEASSVVQVKSQVAGELQRVHFTEGQNVEKGSPLFDVDPRPFQEALRQAEAAIERDRAQIRQGEATLARDRAQARNAEVDAERYGELAKAGVVSRTQNDQAQTSAEVYRESARATQATIESAKAALAADLAAVDRAKLDLSYCQIRSPLAGRTGNLLVHPGNLVKANDAALVVIHQVAPIFVNFNVPEQHLAAIRRLSAARTLKVRATPKDNPGRSAEGEVSVIDNTVDTNTGTIKLKATFSNRDRLLWPGQFVQVTLALEATPNATVVPAEAVQAGQNTQMIWVVKPDGTAESRPVKVGRTIEKRVIVESGVAPGETVVTDGQLRLAPGTRIRVVDAASQTAGQS